MDLGSSKISNFLRQQHNNKTTAQQQDNSDCQPPIAPVRTAMITSSRIPVRKPDVLMAKGRLMIPAPVIDFIRLKDTPKRLLSFSKIRVGASNDIFLFESFAMVPYSLSRGGGGSS